MAVPSPPLSLAACILSLHLFTGGGATPLPMSTDVIKDYGGFLAIECKGLQPDQAYQELPLERRCQCRSACNAHPPCLAFSFRKIAPDRYLCSLAKENVYVNTPTSMADSIYAVRKDLVEPHRFDNLFYKRLDMVVAGFNETKAACAATPGYRMISVRFEAQMALAMEFCLGRAPTASDTTCVKNSPGGWFFVDMVKVNGEPLLRGKLPLPETDLTSVMTNMETDEIYIYAHSGKLHDETPTWSTLRPVCQANVFGVTW